MHTTRSQITVLNPEELARLAQVESKNLFVYRGKQ
jgi:hypothetical protein